MPTDIPQLIAALAAADPVERARAADQLARLGPDARAAAVPLVQTCGDQEEEVREWAVAALEEMGPPPVTDMGVLASLLGGQNADGGYWAATLLGRLGGDAGPAVPALAAALSRSTDVSVRQRAAWALGKIGPPATGALDALKQAADGDDPRLARLADRAIEQITG